MPAIGITGGISTGKTTFCECLCALLPGARTFNADHAARRLVDSDPEVRREMQEEFGADIYSTSGDLNRARLRAIVLESAAKKSALEQILHPRIRRQWSAEAQTFHSSSSDFFLADIPLLYETGGEVLCDRVVVVASSQAVQLARLLARGTERRDSAGAPDASPEAGPELDAGDAMKLIKSQMSLDEKIKRADHVVWNNDGLALLAQQANDLVRLWQAESWVTK